MNRKANIALACLAWFLTNITMLAGTSTHFLDIEELKSINYDIDILESPVLFGRPLHSEVVYLSSKFGQRYECQLPDVADVGKVQEEERTATETGISDLLKPMELAPCLLKSKDWWTYEFCYGKHVRQFHMDNNKITGDVITIGVFESEMDWENKSHSAAKRHRLNRYHSHRYVNGSKCDITGKPREAEVRFLCAENELDTMSRIDEPESCRYVITIHTMRICHHPYLKPPAKAKPKTILCYPLLMPDQYEQYMHQQTKHRYSKEAQEKGITDEEQGDGDDDDYDYDDEDDLELLEEHHLHGDMSSAEPDESPVGEDQSKSDVHPGGLTDILTEVMKGVQGTIDKINTELEDETEGADRHMTKTKTSEEDDDEVDDYDVDDEDEDDDDDDEDDEFMELMKLDYKELTKYIQELPTSDQEEAMRLAKLVQEIEASFENIEAMERVLDQIQEDMTDLSTAFEDPLEPVGEPLQDLLEPVGDPLELVRDPLKPVRDPLEPVGDSLEPLRDPLEPVRDPLEPVGDPLEPVGEPLEAVGEPLEPLGDPSDGPVTVLETNMKDDITEEGIVMDKAEDGKKMEEEEEESEIEKKKDLEDQLTSTLNKLVRQLKEKVHFKGEATSSESKTPSQSSDLGSRVRVRVTRVKLDKNQKASSEQELKFLDTDHQDLEEAISDQLEKSGLGKEGGQLEVRILSYVPEEWPDQGIEDEGFAVLSEEDSSYFRNMIFGLVMRDDGEVQSQQAKLQKNYGFQWTDDSNLDQTTQSDQELEEKEVQILIPRLGAKQSAQGKSKSSDTES